jgi:hypothetical protein
VPLRLVVAYALIALIAAILCGVYRYVTHERRAYDRVQRAYRRARRAAERRS